MYVKGLMLNRLTVSVLGALMYVKGYALQRTTVGLKVCDTTNDENNLRRFLEASIAFNPTAHSWTPTKFLSEQLPWLSHVRVPQFSDKMDTAARQRCFDQWYQEVLASWADYRKEHGITSLNDNTIEVMALLPETIEELKRAEAAEQAALKAAAATRETEIKAAHQAAQTTVVPDADVKTDDTAAATSTEAAPTTVADNADRKPTNGHSTAKADTLNTIKLMPTQTPPATAATGVADAPTEIAHANGVDQAEKVLVGV
jgi:hypothetical protein